MCLGIPGQVIAITDPERLMGLVDVSGVRREVNLACVVTDKVDDVVGGWVLVHVGFALSLIDEEEARLTLAALAELGEAEEEIEAMRRSAEMLEASQ
ncbi:Hydrogenase isoenzymes formation protein HypC [Hartmannibacter diazotrophicus]|uniref:Hydrogenase maturation factor HypC n=1 Tax=Hartmannibacter diazotrophicus TaxID=1482074 RepID=A0A2C9D1A7_9HYPH|nr:HypC/HybG/HupF family hydrogenase formation chaperone [Hartmannibacter diazotrophicus]SON53948.1 Hydrogenase isoenzymes formation protein HypC [Hartmannibacter diazotrophicus]